MKHRSIALAALSLGLIAAVPTQAKADSCLPMLNDFVNYLNSNSSNTVSLLQTTNYQANYYWNGAHAWGTLSPATGGPVLSGTARRIWSDGHNDEFSIEFYSNGSVRFDGVYGPYPATCYGNKFLVVNTGDSFETFTFTKGPIIL